MVDVKRIPELNVLSFDESGPAVGGGGFLYAHRQFPRGAREICCTGRCLRLDRLGADSESCGGGRQFLQCDAFGRYGTTDHFDGGSVLIAGPNGRRELPAEEFFVGPGQTVLGNGEILVEITIPMPSPRSGAAYLRFIPREEMDIAVAGVGSCVRFSADGLRCDQARITLAAVAPTAVRAREAEEFLAGKTPDETTFAQAGELAVRSAKPISDVRGSAAYRIELIKVLTRRSLQQAWEKRSLGEPSQWRAEEQQRET